MNSYKVEPMKEQPYALLAGASVTDTCGTATPAPLPLILSLQEPSTDERKGITGTAHIQGSIALKHQVGGQHYRKHQIQPVEYIIANRIGFLPGNIIKYATRYKDKGGAEDIRKIIQYCKLILEFEYKETDG